MSDALSGVDASTPSISPYFSGSNPSDVSQKQAWNLAFDNARLGKAAQSAGWQPVSPTPWPDAASTGGGAAHSDAYNATVRTYQPYYDLYRNFDQLNSDQQLDARRQVANDNYLRQADKAFIQSQFTDRLQGKPAGSLDEFAGPAARVHEGGARVLGGIQAAGGAFEMAAGGAMVPTGLGAIPGSVLLFHGADNVYHGVGAMAGQGGPTWTHQGLNSAFRSFGVPDGTANRLATLSELGVPIGGAFAAARLPGSLAAAGARSLAGEGAQAAEAAPSLPQPGAMGQLSRLQQPAPVGTTEATPGGVSKATAGWPSEGEAPGSLSAARAWSVRSRLKANDLPTTGKIRFVPEKGYDANVPLSRGPNNGFLDRFGNEWVKGPSRTPGQPFEWDVQLSRTGRNQLGWLSRDGAHINVSLDGRVTHR